MPENENPAVAEPWDGYEPWEEKGFALGVDTTITFDGTNIVVDPHPSEANMLMSMSRVEPTFMGPQGGLAHWTNPDEARTAAQMLLNPPPLPEGDMH